MPTVDVLTTPITVLTRPGTTALLRGIKIQTVQTTHLNYVAQLINAAPAFKQDPAQIDKIYSAANGQAYFVPAAALVRRPRDVPDVFIEHKSGPQGDQYVLRANFDLRRPDGAPANALPLPLDNFVVTLQSPAARRTLTLKAVVVPAPEGAAGVVQRLQASAEVNLADILFTLQQDAGAVFEIRANVHYRIQPDPVVTPPRPVVTPPRPVVVPPRPVVVPPRPIGTRPPIIRDHRTGRSLPESASDAESDQAAESEQQSDLEQDFEVSQAIELEEAPESESGRGSEAAAGEGAAAPDEVSAREMEAMAIAATGFTSASLHKWTGNTVIAPPVITPGQPPVKTATLLLSRPDRTPGYFPTSAPALKRQNGPVYAGLGIAGGAEDTRWLPSPHGYYRSSAAPNQFYVLPDQFGLAFNVEQGLPGLSALLIPSSDTSATGSQAYNVRVRFVIVPELEAERLQKLRDYICAQEGLAYPEFLVGGYKKASYSPARILDGIGATPVGAPAGGAAPGEMEVDGSRGFDLILDCTLGLYGALAGILVSDPGLVQSSVKFMIDTESGEFRAEVPVSLKLTDPANNPLAITVAGAKPGEGPRAAVVLNPSKVQVTVAKIRPTMLFMDDDMPYPVDAVDGIAEPATLSIEPGQQATVNLSPDPAQGITGAPWGAVAVDLSGVRVALDPADVLDRVHQVSPASSFKTAVRVWSFLLKNRDRLPTSLADLYGMNVELKRGAEAPTRVTLTLDNPEATVQVAFSLSDILAGRNPEQPTFQMRLQNLLVAGAAPWSDWQEITGRDFHVAPAGV